jgi:hypothetical protein
MPFGGLATHRFPVERVATLLTLHQALQQIARTAQGLPCMGVMDLSLLWHRRQHGGRNKCGHRDGHPVFGRHSDDRHGPPWLPWAPPRRPQARPPGPLAGFPKRGRPHVCRVLQEAPDHPALPHGLPRPRHFLGLDEPATDLANREALLTDPRQELADAPGFRRASGIAGLAPPPC